MRIYRPLVESFVAGRFFPRDHGRSIVIDHHGYTSGAAWGDEWLPKAYGGQGWHDASARIAGPCVEGLAEMFLMRWEETEARGGAPRRFERTCTYGDVEIIADAPRDGLIILDRYVERVQRAERRVWIENGYFFPPQRLVDALGEAAARGVDVRVIAPSKTDLRIVKWAARGEYERWLARGIRIFEFEPRILHSKAAVIDDDWATVGSLNLNVLSLTAANELNLVVHERRFVETTARYLEKDFGRSREILAREVRARSWVRRALSAILAKLFRWYEGASSRLLSPGEAPRSLLASGRGA